MLSYSTPYARANRAAIRHLSDIGYKVVQCLITHANELGICWPGIRLIAEETGKSKDSVQVALEELEGTGCIAYIRRNERDAYTGQKLVNIYQVSPLLLHIRPEFEAQAWQSWKNAHGKEFALFAASASLSYSEQDRTNNRTNDSQSVSDLHQNQQQQEPLESEHSLSATAHSREDKQERRQDQRKGLDRTPATHQQRSANNQTSRAGQPPGARRPIYTELAPVAKALPDELQERLAKRVREEADIPLRMARGLNTQYGWNTVEVALNNPFVRKADNPGGYLRWLIQGQRIDPQVDLPLDPMERLARRLSNDGKCYTTGEFADFIEH
jgi:hypothetical protein